MTHRHRPPISKHVAACRVYQASGRRRAMRHRFSLEEVQLLGSCRHVAPAEFHVCTGRFYLTCRSSKGLPGSRTSDTPSPDQVTRVRDSRWNRHIQGACRLADALKKCDLVDDRIGRAEVRPLDVRIDLAHWSVFRRVAVKGALASQRERCRLECPVMVGEAENEAGSGLRRRRYRALQLIARVGRASAVSCCFWTVTTISLKVVGSSAFELAGAMSTRSAALPGESTWRSHLRAVITSPAGMPPNLERGSEGRAASYCTLVLAARSKGRYPGVCGWQEVVDPRFWTVEHCFGNPVRERFAAKPQHQGIRRYRHGGLWAVTKTRRQRSISAGL